MSPHLDLDIDGLPVRFPYPSVYPEQLLYMKELKRCLDSRGHGLLEMPTGTGKTISVFSLFLAYQKKHPEIGKLVFCTRTVPEMSKALDELRRLVKRAPEGLKSDFLGIGLSARKNMCVHPVAAGGGGGDDALVDQKCRQMTAGFVRSQRKNKGKPGDNPPAVSSSSPPPARASRSECSFFEKYDQIINGLAPSSDIEAISATVPLPSGVFSMEDLKRRGEAEGWCPYFMSKRMLRHADVIVFNYHYVLDPRVAATALLSGAEAIGGARGEGKEGELQKIPAVVIFDEAHNIDDICVEALTVNLDRRQLERAKGNLTRLKREVKRAREKDAKKLRDEYERLVKGLVDTGQLDPDVGLSAMNQQPSNVPPSLQEALIPASVRKAEAFLSNAEMVVGHMANVTRLEGGEARVEGPRSFLHQLESSFGIEKRTLKAYDDRLKSLLNTLEIVDLAEFNSLAKVAMFCTLLGKYSSGFSILLDPFPEAAGIYDPQIELSCLDAAIAMKPVINRFSSVVLTSGTLSPLDMYPKLLGLDKVTSSAAFEISLDRECIRPLIVTRSQDHAPLSSRFDTRDDPLVLRGYGQLVVEICSTVPDGVVCFFTSKIYMQSVLSFWLKEGILEEIKRKKLVFFETEDVVATSVALDRYRQACDNGRGAIFMSIARGKVSEGIDFDQHYGRAVVLIGVPFQYSLSRRLRARLSYLEEAHEIEGASFLTFDAMRAAAQCVGRVLRSKKDFGIMVFADFRYARKDKREKMPKWIQRFCNPENINLTSDMASASCHEFLLKMAQPVEEGAGGRGWGGEMPSKVHSKEEVDFVMKKFEREKGAMKKRRREEEEARGGGGRDKPIESMIDEEGVIDMTNFLGAHHIHHFPASSVFSSSHDMHHRDEADGFDESEVGHVQVQQENPSPPSSSDHHPPPSHVHKNAAAHEHHKGKEGDGEDGGGEEDGEDGWDADDEGDDLVESSFTGSGKGHTQTGSSTKGTATTHNDAGHQKEVQALKNQLKKVEDHDAKLAKDLKAKSKEVEKLLAEKKALAEKSEKAEKHLNSKTKEMNEKLQKSQEKELKAENEKVKLEKEKSKAEEEKVKADKSRKDAEAKHKKLKEDHKKEKSDDEADESSGDDHQTSSFFVNSGYGPPPSYNYYPNSYRGGGGQGAFYPPPYHSNPPSFPPPPPPPFPNHPEYNHFLRTEPSVNSNLRSTEFLVAFGLSAGIFLSFLGGAAAVVRRRMEETLERRKRSSRAEWRGGREGMLERGVDRGVEVKIGEVDGGLEGEIERGPVVLREESEQIDNSAKVQFRSLLESEEETLGSSRGSERVEGGGEGHGTLKAESQVKKIIKSFEGSSGGV